LLKGFYIRLFLEPGHPLRAAHLGLTNGLVAKMVFELLCRAWLAFFSFFYLSF
jgi:hypothetical protein